jgi:RNA polymerase sigma-70 factor (ECF subfamily)
VLCLLFNEGYHSVSDEPVVRELCRDALHLAKLVVDEPSLMSCDGVGLLAVMCFGAARIDSRVHDAGHLVPLDKQDLSLWDPALILSSFHLRSRQHELHGAAPCRNRPRIGGWGDRA